MVSRRTVLLGSASAVGAIGALVVGWTALPPKPRLVTTDPLPVGPDQSALNGWVKIGADNSVGIVMCKSEMGQGIYTGLAMVLAEELDADWTQVRVERAPIDKTDRKFNRMRPSMARVLGLETRSTQAV